MSNRLYKKLEEYSKGNTYPFHMPGHKRSNSLSFLKDAYDIDITEIDGFDNLHDAKEIISEAEKSAAKLYKSEETHFLVNGSSCGILAAISAVTERGDKIIVARNSHKAVYNAIFLNGLEPIYLYPDIITSDNIASSVDVGDVEKAILENRDAKAVVITSPTYDGVISDIFSITKIAHEFDIPVIVDEAHGALFYIEGRSAVINNADIVINSLHKTLPALTSTALIHINGKLVNREKIKKYLSIFQTSSPSYVLMGSIDYAVSIMEEKGPQLYRDHCVRILRCKEALKKLRNIKYIDRNSLDIEGVFDFDESKVLLSVADINQNRLSGIISEKENGISQITGRWLSDELLKKYDIQVEMSTVSYSLLMLTVMDSDEGIDRLINALFEIDDYILTVQDNISNNDNIVNTLKGKVGEISDKTVFAYPPGIPIIVEGEVITKDCIEEIDKKITAGLDIKGL